MNSDRTSMKHVSHTPPSGDAVTNIWQRGPKAEAAAEAEAKAEQPADD
ncbi:hypothetical protein [Halopelagius longus]|uniref:Uncharacterized protein n=1 Tax=Halopelagius longus TaxID=1236180 RepID=A0A1H1AXW1_9EURY|nr:hypothetical protein [Halopelagius longus]SDQ44558.1 hypothetical protein SAMN05216278_1543 [Halopelagius longus]